MIAMRLKCYIMYWLMNLIRYMVGYVFGKIVQWWNMSIYELWRFDATINLVGVLESTDDDQYAFCMIWCLAIMLYTYSSMSWFNEIVVDDILHIECGQVGLFYQWFLEYDTIVVKCLIAERKRVLFRDRTRVQ